MHGWIFTSTPRSFDVDSKSLRSLSSYLFTQFLRNDKRAKRFHAYWFYTILSSFQFKSIHAMFIKQLFCTFFPMNNAVQYIYIYIYIFISFTFNYNSLVISSYAISYALNHSNHKSCIFQSYYHFALNKLNLCIRCTR